MSSTPSAAIAAISGHMYPSGIEGMYISVRMRANRALALLGDFPKLGIFGHDIPLQTGKDFFCVT